MIKSSLFLPKKPFQDYPHWNTGSPSVPLRSRLFRLEPIGIGTADVECLTSYIARLAEAHSVSPRKLLCKEVLAPAGKQSVHYSASSQFSACQINGMTNLAGITTIALEALTLRNDLRYMTMLAWKNALSSNQLMRTQKAWCATCYEERITADAVVYDSLIWMLRPVSICQWHHERLRQICYHCKHPQPLLSTFYRPGYCSRCQRWLGNTETLKGEPERLEVAEEKKQISIINLIGELLSCSPRISLPQNPQIFRENLIQHINNSARGNINLFSDLVFIWSGTIRRLLKGETKLRLEILCQLCIKLNVLPLDLLCKEIGLEICGTSTTVVERNDSQTNISIPWDNVEAHLQAAVKETPPPSLEAVSRRIGYYPPRVKRHFSKLCTRISSRYWEYIEGKHPPSKEVRKALRAALKEHPPPSLQCVLKRLGCKDTGYYYYSNYLDLCLAVAQRYKDRRNRPFDKETARKQLQAALIEEPVPSFSEVSRRLGHNREFVRLKLPELSRAVTARYVKHQSVLRSEKAKRLREVIREAIEKIVASGLYVSEARVKEYVRMYLGGYGRQNLFKQAFQEIKLEIGKVK